MNKKFILPFAITQSINVLEREKNEPIQQASSITHSDQKILYLKFKSELTSTLKVTCIYTQHRSLAIDSQRRAFKNYDADQ